MSSVLHPFGGRLSRHFGDSLSPDTAYLSYHDIRLTRHDINCIKHDWLTDNAIAFWEEYLEHEKLVKYPRAHIVLLRPSMSFMLMQSRDPLSLQDALPKFKNVTHIFLPINNAKNVEIPEAGSHWSLLVVSATDGVAFHYDSLGGDNHREAQVAANKMSELLRTPLRYAQIRDAPQQENMNDCGVFVCMFMQTILVDKLLRAADNEKVSVSLRNESFDAKRGRKDMLRIIEEFRKEGERRRSRSPSPFRSKSPPRIGDEQLPQRIEDEQLPPYNTWERRI